MVITWKDKMYLLLFWCGCCKKKKKGSSSLIMVTPDIAHSNNMCHQIPVAGPGPLGKYLAQRSPHTVPSLANVSYPSDSILAANCTGEQKSQQDLYNLGAFICIEQSTLGKRDCPGHQSTCKGTQSQCGRLPLQSRSTWDDSALFLSVRCQPQVTQMTSPDSLERRTESTYGVRQAGLESPGGS